MSVKGFYNLHFSAHKKYARLLKDFLGFVPNNLALYRLAFQHRSLKFEKGSNFSNERLEFLGDALLGLLVAEVLFKLYPHKDEGFLTKLRSKIVNRAYLNQLAHKLDIGKFIKCKDQIRVSHKDNRLGNTFEALIAAIYLDKGHGFTKKFLNRIIQLHVAIHDLEHQETNFKSRLVEWCQLHSKPIAFRLIANDLKESSKLFTVQALIDGQIIGMGKAFNKKDAEKLAAQEACNILSI